MGGGSAGAQDKKLTDWETNVLKRYLGLGSIHELKEWFGADAEQDLFKKPDGTVVVKNKDGQGEGEPTGYRIKNGQAEEIAPQPGPAPSFRKGKNYYSVHRLHGWLKRHRR
jgi:hypothetical protein